MSHIPGTPDYGEPWLAKDLDQLGPRARARILACVNACQGMIDPETEIIRLRVMTEVAWKMLLAEEREAA